MAALLGAINAAACTGPGRRLATAHPGGGYRIPPPENLPACEHALGSRGEFIFDVHTHHVIPQLPWRTTAPETLRLVLDMLPPDCTASNPLTCVDRSAYLHDVFLARDITVALLSDLPSTGDSTDRVPFAAAEGTGDPAASLTRDGASRLLLQNVLAPNFGPQRAWLEEEMTRNVETGQSRPSRCTRAGDRAAAASTWMTRRSDCPWSSTRTIWVSRSCAATKGAAAV